jgi:hypothetical protein
MQLTYSVEADVSPDFAWRYRTDVANWNDPPARFTLDGAFEDGSSGTTMMPGQPPLHWWIREVRSGKSFVMEMPLDQAVLSFEWLFEELPGQRTKMTQNIVLSGDNAPAYAAQVEAGFGANLADGMRRIAAEMAAAANQSKRDPGDLAG